MSEPITLTLPRPSFEALVEATHKTQRRRRAAARGTTTVRVSLVALEALLIDHGRLLRAVPHKEPQ